MSRLDKFGAQNDRWTKGAKRDARPTWRIVAGIASLMGAKYKYNSAEEVFNELAAHAPPFKGMSYRKIGNKGMILKQKETAPITA